MQNFATIEDLENALFACTDCPLRQDCIGPVSFNGTPSAPLMLVGEGPGGVEDEYGTPLVGPSGKLLDKALWSVGVTRDKVYTTNIIKCRPKGNRTPTLEESRICAKLWFEREVDLVKPQVIVGLGNVALKYLWRPEAGIKRSHGQWFSFHGIPALATFHPAYLLRLAGHELVAAKWDVFHDLENAVTKIRDIIPDWQSKAEEPYDLLTAFAARKNSRQK